MKVLLGHKFFYDHGGPETVLFLTRDLLQAAGHQVVDFAMADPRNRPSPYAAYFAPNVDLRAVRPTPASARAALNFLDSREAARRMRRLVRDTRPDVAHLHSINHQLTPSVLRVLRDEGVPAVMTLHDYKLVCPAYTMLARGAVCERCAGGRFFRASTTRCRGLARSLLLSAESYLQHRLLRSYDGVALFLSPSAFLARKFREMGFAHPLEVLPNPGPPPAASTGGERGSHVLFVGRLAPEKGVRTLARAAVEAGVALKVAGDGPELPALQREFAGAPAVEFLGRVEPARVGGMMAEALAVAVPSEWYENQPMVVLEAFANATPVIGADIGGIPELVIEGETGLLHAPGDAQELAARLRWAATHPGELRAMGERAQLVAQRFTPDAYLRDLLDVYARVTAQRPAAQPTGVA
ncbi:MAG TPA: glycosyltransferase [Dehalococcoidia bacterium]|nr:glycosyltransferase [Dehalococcoidia bacterium]